jgi:hypothetical protein
MKSLDSYISTPIASQLAQLQKINRALYEIVPIEFLGHIQVAGNPQSGTLHIYADSPAWAAKLRFYKPSIASGLTSHAGFVVKALRISIHPKLGERKTAAPKKPSLSRHSAQLLACLANNTEDPELKRALTALAKHTAGK